MQDTVRGQPRARAWPRKRGSPKNPEQAANVEKFSQVQKAANYVAPVIMKWANDTTQNSPLLPRDVLTMMLYNRLWAFDIEGLGWRWPLPAITEVSDTLDVLGDTVGDLLVRTPEGWRAQADPNAGAGQLNAHLATISGTSPTYVSGQTVVEWNAVLNNPKGWWDPAKRGFTPNTPGWYMMFACVRTTGTRASNMWSGRDNNIYFNAYTPPGASRSPITGGAPVLIDTPGQTIQCITFMSSAGAYQTGPTENWFLVIGPIG